MRVALIVGSTAAVRAELVWEATSRTLLLDADQTDAVVRFPFVNRSAEEATIVDVKVPCHCTEPELDKRKFAAGERGEIRLKYHHADGALRSIKSATVVLDEPGSVPTELTVQVIAQAPSVTFRPQALLWIKTQPASPKRIRVQLAPGRGLQLVAAESMSPGFEVELHASSSGGDLLITPVEGKERSDTAVTVTVTRAGATPLHYAIPLLVR